MNPHQDYTDGLISKPERNRLLALRKLTPYHKHPWGTVHNSHGFVACYFSFRRFTK